MSSADKPEQEALHKCTVSHLPESLRACAHVLPSYLTDTAMCHLVYYPSIFEDAVDYIAQISAQPEKAALMTFDMSWSPDELVQLVSHARAVHEYLHIVIVKSVANTDKLSIEQQDDVGKQVLEAGADELIVINQQLEALTPNFVLSNSAPIAGQHSVDSIDWSNVIQVIANNAKGAVTIKSLDHRFLFVNSVFLKFSGLTERDVLGKDDLEMGISPEFVLGNKSDNFRGTWKLDNDAVRGGKSVTVYESSTQYSPNQARLMRTTRTPLCNSVGEVSQLLVQSEDITKQSRIEHDLDSLTKIMEGMVNQPDLISIFSNVTMGLRKVTGADYCYLSQVNNNTGYLETVASAGPMARLNIIKHRKGQGVAGTAWKSKKLYVAVDYQQDEHRLAAVSETKQACGIPLLVNGEVQGVMGVAYKNYYPNIRDDLPIITKYAQLSVVVLEHMLLSKKNQEEIRRTEAVTSVGQKLDSADDLQVLLDKACINCISAFDAVKVHVLEYKDQRFKSMSAWELIDGKACAVEEIDSDTLRQSVCQWCMDNLELATVPENYDDPRETDEIHKLRRLLKRGATVVVPLAQANEPYGCLVIQRERGAGDFTAHDINLLKHLGSQLYNAIRRVELIDQVLYRANHDLLTGLFNRSFFEHQLSEKISQGRHQSKPFMLLFIDLDGFKAVNDTFGHGSGDELLIELAKRFKGYFHSGSSVARIGGDEFGIIVDDLDRIKREQGTIENFLQGVVELVEQEFIIGEFSARVSSSIGVSNYPEDGNDPIALLKFADIAMYEVKHCLKGAYRIYDGELGKLYDERIQLESQLARAINNKELRLFYQPKVSCLTGRVEGVEALIRWQHPKRGLLSPYHFITMAEESGLIVDIGNWVITEAIRQLSVWTQSSRDISIAVNVAAPQLANSNFAEMLLQKIEIGEVRPSSLELEVTESVVMNDIGSVQRQLELLKQQEISIAIDDFGTGYSSLRYLKDLPLDILKIDKSFIDNLCDGEKYQSIARTIVSIAKTLNLRTVAEGVETIDQLAIVNEMGCDYIQGYLYSPPVDADEILGVIDEINASAVAFPLSRAG